MERQGKKQIFIGALSHISLASFLCDIGKKCRPKSDAVLTPQNTVSDEGLHVLIAECSIEE